MPAVKLPRFFEKTCFSNMVTIDNVSSVLYNQSIAQNKVEMVVTTSMLGIILKGRKIIHTDNGDIEAGSGDIFFAQKGAYLLSERLNDEHNYQSLIFFIDDRYLADFAQRNLPPIARNKTDSGDATGIYKITSYPLLKACFDSVLPCFLSDYGNKKELLKIKLEELLLHLLNTDESRQFVRFLHTFLYPSRIDIEQYINEHFHLPLTLDEFARQTGRCLTIFKKEFKKIFDMPPKEWINNKRLERAYNLLANTDASVSEVCFDVGFNSMSHFITIFRNRFGKTPKKIQRANADDLFI